MPHMQAVHTPHFPPRPCTHSLFRTSRITTLVVPLPCRVCSNHVVTHEACMYDVSDFAQRAVAWPRPFGIELSRARSIKRFQFKIQRLARKVPLAVTPLF